jgi:signal transduction histidine kinase
MTFLPNTLAGRTILVLLAGLVTSNLIGLLIFAGERNQALTNIAGVKAAERIVAVVQTVERTPSPGRAGAACTLSGPSLSVMLAPTASVVGEKTNWRSTLLSSTIQKLLEAPKPERLRVTIAEYNEDTSPRNDYISALQQCGGEKKNIMGMMMANSPMQGMTMSPQMVARMQQWRGGDVLRVSYRLDDNRWLNFSMPSPRFSSLWQSRFFVAFFVMAVVVSLLSIWAVRRSTAPLALFAWAAERLGRDVNAPDLPEKGPYEVNRAAKAFNKMQRRLRSLINDRTQMLAAISHDLRTPITRLRLRAEFVEDTEQRDKMLNDLEQMEEMIAATLAFARDDNANEPRQNLDLAGLVQSVCDDASDVGHDVVYTGSVKEPFSGRPLALRRAFTNLVDNAVKYGQRARVNIEVSPENFIITIEDDGPGIANTEIERVFEPFYRVETSRNRDTGGTGLGLAVVRSIIRSHGGDISLTNLPKGGLCATVTQPREEVLS